jgi:hypothetical protein
MDLRNRAGKITKAVYSYLKDLIYHHTEMPWCAGSHGMLRTAPVSVHVLGLLAGLYTCGRRGHHQNVMVLQTT